MRRLASQRGKREAAVLAQVDGNKFYVSCERVFRLSLVGRPVIVLSDNDSCAVACRKAAIVAAAESRAGVV